jgi:Acyl CoA binding protein
VIVVKLTRAADRVFSHALNIVNKIRTGAEKPPAATRLQLYGLYKQSMGTWVPKARATTAGGKADGRVAQRGTWTA